MPTFIIEREIPGASDLDRETLAGIAQKSNDVVDQLGVPYKWLHSYVAGDKIYCVHETDDIDTIYKHAENGGFPANLVVKVANVIDPTTADW